MKINAKKILALSTTLPLFFGLAGNAFAQTQYSQATVNWPTQPNTRCYRIYYKESTSANWQNAVHCKDLRAGSFSYTIGYLKPNTSYTYNIQAVNYQSIYSHWLGEGKLVEVPQQ